MTHTPGPWSAVTEDDPRGQPVPYYAGLICLVQKGPEGTLAVVTDGRQASSDEWADNARLLASAPELLQIARIFLGEDPRFQIAVGGNPNAVDKMLDAARATIAKASGGKSTDAAELTREGA